MAARDPIEALLRQVITLHHIANGQAAAAEELIAALFEEIVAALVKLDPTAVQLRYRAGRLDALNEKVRELAGETYDQIYRQQVDALGEIGKHEAKQATMQLRAALGDGNRGKVAPTTGLDATFFRVVARERPLEGALLKDWFRDQERKTVFRVGRQIQLGMVNGETIDQMVRRIRGASAGIVRGADGKPLRTKEGGFVPRYTGGAMQTSTRDAEAIVRTAVNHISTAARKATFEANADLVDEWDFVATLDARTTPQCQALDGKRFRVDDPDAPWPPRHVRCRSTAVPVVAWKKLGLEPPPEGTRASMDGQVPAGMNYETWLKAKGDTPEGRALQDEILGPARAQLFREGKVGLDELVRSDGRRVRLEELQDGGAPEATGPEAPAWREVFEADIPNAAASQVYKREAFARFGNDPEFADFFAGWEKWVDGSKLRRFRPVLEDVRAGRSRDPEALAFWNAVADHAAPTPTLHRGISLAASPADVLKQYRKGGEFDMTLSSFSSDSKVADIFALEERWDRPTQVIFRLREGGRALKVENLSGFATFDEREWIAAGRFRVVSAKKSGKDRVVIEIEQTAHIERIP
jgi:SPP1 gp7 family putative phage head morphogenesis protein